MSFLVWPRCTWAKASLISSPTRCSLGNGRLLLEFTIPRKERRIDIVLLVRNTIVILEAKAATATSQAKRQVEEYALLLHYFHQASSEARIVPIIVSPETFEANYDAVNQLEMFPQMPGYRVTP